VVRKVQTWIGLAGYLDQVERARRFLKRAEDIEGFADAEFQDLMWAFFQNCWHIKDWVLNDERVPQATRSAIAVMALNSIPLKVCEQLCNGTKHLGPTRKKRRAKKGPIAKHGCVETTVDASGRTEMDCMIDTGAGKQVSGRLLAHQCIAEWASIFQSHGLPTARPRI
jgi:hypothetical protein